MSEFNPNMPSISNGNYFALPFAPEESAVVLLSVPWDVTTSYRPGTARGPDAILDASLQLDLCDFHNPAGWRKGIGTLETDYTILDTSRRLREEAEKVIIHLESGGTLEEEYVRRKLRRINEASEQLNAHVYEEAKKWMARGKRVGVVGGDHSVPLGAIRAAAEHEGAIGVLHIDAHADLREAYEGFSYSHASIMYNVLAEVSGVTDLVQVAVRDLCEEEVKRIALDGRIACFDDAALAANRFKGMTWDKQCAAIIEKLPQKVYVSFDIDGLDPSNCPSTGTPVPGGISYNEAVYLLAQVAESGRRIVGFDLCEVAPDPRGGAWNANVGARVLYKLCNILLLTP
ncbi:MAG: agmatinase family protein [Rikenellaceae bacterium]|jgi:agmatinase|nr:agmatinase family protein [Rikenellaceae bacterium]